MIEKTYHLAQYLGLFKASVTHIGFKMCFHILKRSLESDGQLMLYFIWSKSQTINFVKIEPKGKNPKEEEKGEEKL